MRSVGVVACVGFGAVVVGLAGGVKPASLVDQLGLRNRDSLRCFDGWSLSSPEAALEAYSKARRRRASPSSTSSSQDRARR